MRPSRGEIDAAAMALLARHSAQILATARRYAASSEDAEDAYQRGLEILLTKAPTTREEELVPWLKTVVKHEAFALRRQRDRITPVTGDGKPVEGGTAPAATHEQAERWEQLSHGAEALRRLKPQEVRCLVLKAEGLSYREICETTGFTYTKVNRCLTEGRQALTRQLAGIEDGAECARLAPLLSALADGEADADAVAQLRPHLRTLPGLPRPAARVPRRAGAGGGAGAGGRPRDAPDAPAGPLEAALGALQQKAEALLGATQQKAAALGERAHAAVELTTGQKVAAVAASAAVIAGGGTAVDQLADHHGRRGRRPRPSARAHSRVRWRRPQPGQVHRRRSPRRPRRPPPRTMPSRQRARPTATGSGNEFGPSGAPATAPGSSSTPIPPRAPVRPPGPPEPPRPPRRRKPTRGPPRNSRPERTP